MPEQQNNSVIRAEFGLVTQAELGELLAVTKETLREWRRLKQGPSFVRIGKGVFYRRQDVTNWIDGNVVAPSPVNV